MTALKHMFIGAVLMTVGYGAFLTYTNPPVSTPPEEALHWDSAPQVQLPPAPLTPPGSLPAVSGAAPAAVTPPPLTPANTTSLGPDLGAPPSFSATLPPTPSTPPALPVSTPLAESSSVAVTPPSAFASSTTSATPTGIAPVPAQPDDRVQFIAAMQKVQSLLDEGKLSDALLALSPWQDHGAVAADEHEQLLDLLDRVAGTVVYSREHLLEPAYVVQPGDTPSQLTHPFHTPCA